MGKKTRYCDWKYRYSLGDSKTGGNLIKPIQAIPLKLEGYEYYTVSYWGGIVRNTINGNILKGWLNGQRYRRLTVGGRSNRINVYMQRLVASTWTLNPLNKSDVNHADHIRDHNSVPNLGWMTHSENMAYIVHKCDVEILEQQKYEAPF